MLHRSLLVAGLAFLVGGTSGCGGHTTTSSPGAGSAAKTTRAAKSKPPYMCQISDGGECRGPLNAGTYTSKLFQPRVTYTLPAGWANWEDLPGNFNLVPPGQTQPGINAGTSDFIGVYASVGAPNGCQSGTDPHVGNGEPAFARWVSADPALQVAHHTMVTIGGLKGDVFDLSLARHWSKGCPYSKGQPVAPLLTGVGVSQLDHNIGPGATTRLYLLRNGHATLAIELADVHGGRHLSRDDPVIRGLEFGH
jgi:hypothetical protein